MSAPPDYRELEEKIADVRRQKEDSIEAQDFERAAGFRDDEKRLMEERKEREHEWREAEGQTLAEVDEEQIAEVLSSWTGIPVTSLTEEETAKLLRMEDELHKRIVSQHDAITAVSRSIRRTRAGSEGPQASGRLVHLPRPLRVSERPRPPRRSPTSCSVTRTR